jgi:SAM-dependent methyltransferase
MKWLGTGSIRHFVRAYIASLGNLAGKLCVDIPAGSGAISRYLRDAGAQVEAYDLFPEAFRVEGMTCTRADLHDRLPIPSEHADMVFCIEGIEHLSDQIQVLYECSRILKPGGRLLLTTPNLSNLRARLWTFVLDSYVAQRLPINELNAVRQEAAGQLYFGHVFTIRAQRLRVLARVAGLRIVKVHSSKVSYGSVLLAPVYPLLALANLFAYVKTSQALGHVDAVERQRVLREVVWLNLHPVILFDKKLFLEFEKVARPPEH